MKKIIWFAFVIDLLLFLSMTIFSDPYADAGHVELHVTMLRLIVEAAALAVLKEMRRG